MMKTKITLTADKNYRIKRLDTQLNKTTNRNSIIKVPKIVKPTNNEYNVIIKLWEILQLTALYPLPRWLLI